MDTSREGSADVSTFENQYGETNFNKDNVVNMIKARIQEAEAVAVDDFELARTLEFEDIATMVENGLNETEIAGCLI